MSFRKPSPLTLTLNPPMTNESGHHGSKQSRTLVLCFDGTANQYDAENTNVVRFFSLLKKDDINCQLCYYQAGIGTYFNPGVVSPFFEWWAKILDQATAWYLNVHVMEGYRFLMQNYCTGDKICLFGFSRGAYTARALAGFLHKIGLLTRDNDQQIPFAYKLYTRTDPAGLALCAGFKETYCRPVKIEFIGVWDTVASVGLITNRTLPFVISNDAIRTFRHALSLDERRCKFQANTYHRTAPSREGAMDDPEQASPVLAPSGGRGDDEECDVLEVWFAGCHSDVGGGAVPNNTDHSLANITLRWMVREVIGSQCGILFDEAALARNGIADVAFPRFSPFKFDTTGRRLDAEDAVRPLHDELVLDKAWWMLEILPFMEYWQDTSGYWRRKLRVNLGKGRTIYDSHPKFHTSVRQRIADKTLKYHPRATWKRDTEVFVE
ncbi:hypothetical protein AX15_003766 [Amanita polypyramis BW_CC]|nr:hypothetical protein AX15_003766 [Amanita polypyramis BW_CC]